MRCIRFVVTILLVAAATSPAVAALSYFGTVSDYDVVQGPPFPTPCHRTDVAHERFSTFELDGQMEVGITRALDADGALVPFDLEFVESHAPNGGFSDNTAFELLAGSLEERTGSRLEVSLHIILTATEGQFGKLNSLRPELAPNDPARYFDIALSVVSADIACSVDFTWDARHELALLVEPPSGIELTDARVVVREQTLSGERAGQPYLADRYFSEHPDANFDLILTFEGDLDTDAREFIGALTFTGRFISGTNPVEESSWAAIKAAYGQ